MKSWLKLCWNTVKVFIAFSICTAMFYYGLRWLNQEYEDYHRYDEPEGKAVKVFQLNLSEEGGNRMERLLYFYKSGE
ncbi:YqzK family protein [Fictibacillus sp. Mic-4]|uniref:YqzK family protein n=1 Tax=Fictibacillus TaxID=1329200 RepID=UPI0003FD59F5|nr:YqzK family protein [Fictibacillus gelatini]